MFSLYIQAHVQSEHYHVVHNMYIVCIHRWSLVSDIEIYPKGLNHNHHPDIAQKKRNKKTTFQHHSSTTRHRAKKIFD